MMGLGGWQLNDVQMEVGMREFWVNVYADHLTGEPVSYGARHASIDDAREWSAPPHNGVDRLRYRVHVKLKPEGAPKRYRDGRNRRAWEQDAADCQRLMRSRGVPATALSMD